MIWRKQAIRLIEVLGLKGHPISVSYTMDHRQPTGGQKIWVCEALLSVRSGKEVTLTAQSSACMSGAWQLGLTPPPTGEEYKSLARFLVEGEKLCASYAAIYRMNKLISPAPFGIGDCVIFAPLDMATLAPDLVVFIVNAEQASRLLTLATFDTGIPPRIEMFGSTCHQVIAYPLLSGELNVSVMDITSRKRYSPDELFVTVPSHILPRVVEAIDKSTAGVAPFEPPKDLSGNLPFLTYRHNFQGAKKRRLKLK